MGHVGSQEDDRLVENFRPDRRDQNGVDPSQLDVDLETQVGQGLGRCLVDILGLDALCGHAQNSVADALNLHNVIIALKARAP